MWYGKNFISWIEEVRKKERQTPFYCPGITSGRKNMVVKGIRAYLFWRCLLYQLWTVCRFERCFCRRNKSRTNYWFSFCNSWEKDTASENPYNFWWDTGSAKSVEQFKIICRVCPLIFGLLCRIIAGDCFASEHIFSCWESRVLKLTAIVFWRIFTCKRRTGTGWFC